MNKEDDINWSVLEGRGLAVTSTYGLGRDWHQPLEKVAPVMVTDAESRQVTTENALEEHPNPSIEVDDVDKRVQDLENRDFAVGRPLAGASILAAEATFEDVGAAA